MKMRRVVLSVVVVLFVFAVGQTVTSSDSGAAPQAAPQIAFDVTKADIDTLLKNAPPAQDQPARIVDMGKYNLEVAVVHRGPTTDKPGEPLAGLYHDSTAEIYIILSGTGVLTTGGAVDMKPTTNYCIMNGPGGVAVQKKTSTTYCNLNGPGGGGRADTGSYSRWVNPGDIIMIPPWVFHGWSQVAKGVTYLSIRPDPDRVLPAGYVNPLLLKNLPPEVK